MTGRGMRVLMVSPTAAPGGAEEVFRNLAVGLIEAGHQVHCVILQNGPLAEQLQSRGIDAVALDLSRTRNVIGTLKTLARVRHLARRFRPDVIFASHAKGHVYATLSTAGFRCRRYWRQVTIPDPPNLFDTIASRMPASAIICNSRQTQIVQQDQTSRTCIVIHPGVNAERFSSADPAEIRELSLIGPEDVVVSLIGRLQPWKGQVQFLHAAAKLAPRHANVKFLLVGGALLGWEGDYPKVLAELVIELQLNDRVTMVGHQDLIEPYFALSDIVVNASDAEPFGNVVIQAMAAGRPVVAVNAGGPAEIIDSGLDGLLVHDNLPDTLAEGIARLLDDPAMRQSMGDEARRKVEAKFSLQAMVRKFESAMGVSHL